MGDYGEGILSVSLDKTTCGGRILSGAPDDTYHIGGIERQQVRVGDPVTCGKHEGDFASVGEWVTPTMSVDP